MTKDITIKTDAETCEATIGGVVYTMKLDEIHPIAAAKIFAYGFQRFINDKTGGKDSATKAAIVTTAIANIKAGTIGRTSRASNPMTKYIRNVLRPLVASADAYKDSPDRNAFLDSIYAEASEDKQELVNKAAAKLLKIDQDAKAAMANIELDFDI